MYFSSHLMYMVYAHGTWYMYMVHVHGACTWYMYLVDVHGTCTGDMYIWYVYGTCICYMYMVVVYSICISYMYMIMPIPFCFGTIGPAALFIRDHCACGVFSVFKLDLLSNVHRCFNKHVGQTFVP